VSARRKSGGQEHAEDGWVFQDCMGLIDGLYAKKMTDSYARNETIPALKWNNRLQDHFVADAKSPDKVVQLRSVT
jgi:flagellar biosynthesis regulator FlaF